ncbi:MAG TPA: CAP domain-containing protein [Candidatus Saccharimonadales bacterium]|nr:CAP domain-containing protein [Candidatus Saccharimonadales bacterium]
MPTRSTSKTKKRSTKTKAKPYIFSPSKFSRIQLIVFGLLFATLGAILAYWSFAEPPDVVVALRDEKPLKVTKDESGKIHYSSQIIAFEILSDNTLVCGDPTTPDVLTTTQLTQAETDSIVNRVIAAGIKTEPDQAAIDQDQVGDLTSIQVKAGDVDKIVSIFNDPQTNQFAQKVRNIAKDVCKKATKQIERDKAPKTKQDLATNLTNSSSNKALAWFTRQVFAPAAAITYSTSDETIQYSDINQTRASVGRSKLPPTTCLHNIAESWTYTMSTTIGRDNEGNYGHLRHNDNLGNQINTKCSSNWTAYAENVGKGGTSQSIYNLFVNNPNDPLHLHYNNIVDTDWNYVGVGAYRGADGILYIAQDFLRCIGCGLATYTTTPVSSTSPAPSSPYTFYGSSQLKEGQRMNIGYYIGSSTGYKMILQNDGSNAGNLVVKNPSGTTVWSAGIAGKGGKSVVMQTDGNFVVYRSDGVPVWSTKTAGTTGYVIVMQLTDGNLVLHGTNCVLWAWKQGGRISSCAK